MTELTDKLAALHMEARWLVKTKAQYLSEKEEDAKRLALDIYISQWKHFEKAVSELDAASGVVLS